MRGWNARSYEVLEWAQDALAALGLPLAAAAWATVFFAVVAMAIVLRRSSLLGHWRSSIAVGVVALIAHLLDYHVTLHVSPTLVAEANPIWRIVIEHFSLPAAKLYGLTGKILLGVLSFQLYAFHLIQRERLFPDRAPDFPTFWREYGRGAACSPVRWMALFDLFAFCFALLGPFLFYVALLNSLIENPLYLRLPSMPLALAAYLALVVAAYFATTYRAFRRRNSTGAREGAWATMLPLPALLTSSLIIASMLIVPNPASACGQCVDHQTRIQLPFAAPLFLLFTLWLLAAPFLRLLPVQRKLPKGDRRPGRRAIAGFWALLTLGTIALAMLTMGSVLLPGLVVSGVWLLYLATALAQRPWRNAADAQARSAARAVAIFHAVFLILGVGTAVRGSIVPRTTEQLVSLSGYSVSAVYREVLPEIIRRGPESVDPLIEATRRSLERKRADNTLATVALFSLGRICTSEAEAFLGEITRDHTRPDGNRVPLWERAGVYGYARCGGPRAVDDLVALHERAADRYRWLSLTALAATASRAGVLRALDEMDALLEAARGGDDGGRIALVTAATLMEASDSKALATLPVMRRVHMVGGPPLVESSPDDLRAEFYWTDENEAVLARDPGELAQRWSHEAENIREHWLSVLD